VLITFGGRADQVRSGMTYVVISLVASTLFITALALIYAATGTVNMADLSVRIAELDPDVRGAFALGAARGVRHQGRDLSRCSSGCPTATRPRPARSPRSSPDCSPRSASTPSSAPRRCCSRPTPDGHAAARRRGFTMVVGVLGAIAQDDIKRILSFHIVSQIGYMIFGLGFFTVAGVAGAIFYIVHNIVVKTALLLVAGWSSAAPARVGCRRSAAWSAPRPSSPLLFALPALSLAGLPPVRHRRTRRR
jgi:multicomponent Na+:H+ antiporter subunit D